MVDVVTGVRYTQQSMVDVKKTSWVQCPDEFNIISRIVEVAFLAIMTTGSILRHEIALRLVARASLAG